MIVVKPLMPVRTMVYERVVVRWPWERLWLIGVLRLILCIPVPPIDHKTWINHNNCC